MTLKELKKAYNEIINIKVDCTDQLSEETSPEMYTVSGYIKGLSLAIDVLKNHFPELEESL